MFSTSLTDSQVWQVAGWTMLHYSWIGALLGAVVFAVKPLLKRSSASVRYVVGIVCLGTLAATPVGIATWVAGSMTSASSLAVSTTQDTSATSLVPERTNLIQPAETPAAARVAPSSSRRDTYAPVKPTQTKNFSDVVGYLPWLWLLGAPLTFAVVATGMVGAERLRRQSQMPADGQLQEQLRQLARALRVSQNVAIGVCDRIGSPLLMGIVRPMILLPAAAISGWSPEQLELVLLHELAHVRRWDNLVNLLQRIVESLLFFQPSVWLVSNWVRREREHCCDEFVVARTGRAREYAETLAKVALFRRAAGATISAPVTGHAVVTSSMAENHLLTRIRHILKQDNEPMRVSSRLLGLAFTACLLGLIVLGHYATRPGRADGPADATVNSALTESERASIRAKVGNRALDPSHAQITGVVIDEQENPVEGIRVTAADWQAQTTSDTTDADGVFALEIDSPIVGSATIRAQSEDKRRQGIYQFESMPGPTTGADSPIRIVLKKAKKLTATVVDAKNKPVEFATVEVIALRKSLVAAHTDRSGKVEFMLPVDVKADSIIALKSGVGFDYFENYEFRPGPNTRAVPRIIRLVLDGARSAQVQAIDSAEAPVAGIEVAPITIRKPGKRSYMSLRETRVAFSKTNAQGIARFDWLPANNYDPTVFVPRSKNYHAPKYSTLHYGDLDAKLTMPLVRHVRATGTVTLPDGKPAAGIVVQAGSRPKGTHNGHRFARTLPDGTYEIDLHANQSHVVTVTDDKWAAKSLAGIDVRENKPLDGLDIQLIEGTVIRGTVNVPPGARPDVTTVVLIERFDELETKQYQDLQRWAKPDANGRYKFRVGPGRYHLMLIAPTPGAKPSRSFVDVLNVTDEREFVLDVDMPSEPSVGSVQQPASEPSRTENLKRIMMAMYAYRAVHDRFPPAVLFGPDGKTPYSWRVALLPFLTTEERSIGRNELYEQYDRNQPWDSPGNRRLLAKIPEIYRCPDDEADSTNSSYFVLTGPTTMFSGREGTGLDDILDGISTTLLVVETKRDIPWTKPEDIPYDANRPMPKLGGFHDNRFWAVLCDGSMPLISVNLDERILRAAMTKAGGDRFNRFELFLPHEPKR